MQYTYIVKADYNTGVYFKYQFLLQYTLSNKADFNIL